MKRVADIAAIDRGIDVRPIIKWAGGKAQLLPMLASFLPQREQIHRYFEPFVGGAALFFALQHPRSTLSDSNAELINLYTIVRDEPDALIAALRAHAAAHDAQRYYEVRAWTPERLTAVQRAARLIYLNKTCYNGLYRVNSRGRFNVPIGRHKSLTICDEPNLRAASAALRPARLAVGDYETVLAGAGAGDFVYFDPPYHPTSATAVFTSYTDRPFDAREQERLALAFHRLHAAGCHLMQSNSDTLLIRELYADFRIERVTANRAINSRADRRGPVPELVILNYGMDGELIAG
jgi:DNA adenine methylase